MTVLCRFYPKLVKKHRSSNKSQLDMPGDLFFDGFADKAVLCGKDTAFQLSRAFPGAEPSWGSCLITADHRELSNRPNLRDQRDPSPQLSCNK